MALQGVAAQLLEDTDAAIVALTRATVLQPDDGESRHRLSLLLELRGLRHLEEHRAPSAVADLARLVAVGTPTAERLFQLGNACSRAGRTDDALACYRRASASDPSHASAVFNGGILLRSAGRLTEAAAALERAVRLSPDFLDARENLCIVLYQLDRDRDSLNQADTLLSLKARRAVQEGQALGLPPLRGRPPEPAGRTRDVVAFSLWGDKDLYLRGALENARLMPTVYPGWICRIYHDDSVPRAVLGELDALGAELVSMPPGSGPLTGLYWRFLASDDPMVRRFVCRDCDSRIGLREKAAVDAWISSGRPFHVMRDHPLHTELILAGMWGGMAGLLPDLEPLIRRFASSDRDRWQDQLFLRSHVWPLIVRDCLVHDGVHAGHGMPFPAHGGDAAVLAVGRRIGCG